MLKVFSLFKIQGQCYNDELSEILIRCTCCNKKFTVRFLISNRKFSQWNKSYLFNKIYHVSYCSSFMDDINEGKNNFAVDEQCEKWCTQGGHGLMMQFFRIFRILYLRNYLSWHMKIYMILWTLFMWVTRTGPLAYVRTDFTRRKNQAKKTNKVRHHTSPPRPAHKDRPTPDKKQEKIAPDYGMHYSRSVVSIK